MVSSVNNSINSLFASFSEVNKVTAPTTAQTSVDPAKRITNAPSREALSESGQQQSQTRNRQSTDRFSLPEERQPSLASFTRPRPLIAPSDEAAVFAETDAGTTSAPTQAAASPESNQMVQNQVSAPLMQRRQSYVANLYAQTNDITFSGERAINQAA